jgi:hypothetical protein
MPSEPIKKGAKKATIKLDLGEVSIERRITPSGSVLELKDDKGDKVSSPQAVLNSLLGALTFDPLEFTRKKSKEQRNCLLEAAGIDLTAIEEEYRAAYEERTLAGRELKKAQGHAASLTKPEAVGKVIDITELLEQRSSLTKKIDAHKSKIFKRDDVSEKIKSRKQRIAQLREEIKQHEADVAALSLSLEELDDELKAVPDAAKLKEIDAEIEFANANAEASRAAKDYEKAQLDFAHAKKAHDDCESAVASSIKKRDDLVASADFGVSGISVSDEGVIFNGIPFEQLSTAQQVEISTLIAMKQNPKLKIILIREGALIGSAIWKNIVDLAKKHDYQLWVEKFQERPGASGLHIRDGRIVAVDGVDIAQDDAIEEFDL